MTTPYPSAAAPVPPSRGSHRRKWPWLLGAAVLVLGIGAACGGGEQNQGAGPAGGNDRTTVVDAVSPTPRSTISAPAVTGTPADVTAPPAALPTATEAAEIEAAETTQARPEVGASRRNAARSAQQYIDMTGFSRSGLIEQLEFEGYSTEDATYAVDTLTVDWNEQAARSARQYLDMTSFSLSGLIEQLEFEGFTSAQAEYGANAVY